MCAANSGVQKRFSLSKEILPSRLSAALAGFRQLVTNSLSSSPCISLWESLLVSFPFSSSLLRNFSTDACLLLLLLSTYFVSIKIKILQHCVSIVSIKVDHVHCEFCKWCRSTYNKTYFILAVELLVRNMCRQIRVQESAEGQPITPAAAEVGNINIL